MTEAGSEYQLKVRCLRTSDPFSIHQLTPGPLLCPVPLILVEQPITVVHQLHLIPDQRQGRKEMIFHSDDVMVFMYDHFLFHMGVLCVPRGGGGAYSFPPHLHASPRIVQISSFGTGSEERRGRHDVRGERMQAEEKGGREGQRLEEVGGGGGGQAKVKEEEVGGASSVCRTINHFDKNMYRSADRWGFQRMAAGVVATHAPTHTRARTHTHSIILFPFYSALCGFLLIKFRRRPLDDGASRLLTQLR